MGRIVGIDETTSYLWKVIISMMKREGRDFTQCELCPAKIPEGKHNLHHTKYDGATFKDIKIVCRSCNQKPQNKLLD